MFDAVLIAGLNHLLGSASWARDRLKRYGGRVVRVQIPPLEFSLQLNDQALFSVSPASTFPDVSILLPADTPFRILQGWEQALSLAHVEGNAEFATELSFVLRNLRWDVEEDLSHVLGDVTAHRLVQGGQNFLIWQRESFENLRHNLQEYLAHETSPFLTRADFEAWRIQLENTTAHLDLLEQRIARYTHHK